MSVKNFKFVSPGVFINEIDNSFIPRENDTIGPVVIGRASRGLAMKPVTVQSYSDFVNTFGDTVPGFAGGDVYRDGNLQSPMYGTYAAKAFLRPNVAPLTYLRLLGQQDTNNDGSYDGQSGWRTAKYDATRTQTNPVAGVSGGGAFGFWLAPSASHDALTTSTFTGETNGFYLGAIIYVQTGSVMLTGSLMGSDAGTADAITQVEGSSVLVGSDTNGNFTLVISGSTRGLKEKFTVNFDDNSENFIRKRLNTNPQLASTQGDFYASSSYVDYWLGESYEQFLRSNGRVTGSLTGLITAISSGSSESVGPHDMKGRPSQEAISGWFIGQDLGQAANYDGANAQKLFRLIGRGHGEWLHKNLKVSIEKIRQSTTTTTDYGTFSVVLRQISDTDNSVLTVERFDNCDLNPASVNFIGRKIGTMYEKYDSTDKTLKSYGEYPNQSKFIRVELSTEALDGTMNASYLPFGYFGPPKWRDLPENVRLSGSITINNENLLPALSERFLTVGPNIPGALTSLVTTSSIVAAGFPLGEGDTGTTPGLTGSFFFPKDILRVSGSDGNLSDQTKAYFGFSSARTTTSTVGDVSLGDVHRLPYITLGGTDNVPVDTTATTYNVSGSSIEGYSYIFTLDDITLNGNDGGYYYSSGSRQGETSKTAVDGYQALLNADINRFTAPFWGGFDGVDITKPDPFYNRGLTSATERSSYAFHTIKRAIDTVADPEYIDMNLLTNPGLTNTTLTEHMIRTCEDRADALAIIDLPDVYIPSHERYYSDRSSRIGTTPIQAANALKDRRIDSSYGATYYPWVQTRDDNTGQPVWIPPTVAMMGVLASSERQSAIWFAPAGFNRGGLSQGAAGIAVTNVSERLSSKNRDTLYESRINPIASFPSSGIVVFGQKTLQERPSALDRINVRRLVIFLKKQISILSTQILFEQNVQATWTRFKGLVEPFLANVKTEFGITEYRLVLDETTTTPDLIDQNILYAKIMVKPARAIEFIAIDFVIMNTGASFDD